MTLENIDEEHIHCAIGDKKHQAGVDSKKEWENGKAMPDSSIMLDLCKILN